MLQISNLGQVVAKMDYLIVPESRTCIGTLRVRIRYAKGLTLQIQAFTCDAYRSEDNGLRLCVARSPPKSAAVGKPFWIRTAGGANASRSQKDRSPSFRKPLGSARI